MKRYEDAELVAARPSEQRQTFRVGLKSETLIELAGSEQVSGVRVGDTGVLTYSPEARASAYTFAKTGRNPMVPLHCPRCQVPMTAGVALFHQPVGMTEDDGPRAPYQPEAAAATGVSCFKCPECGYSEQSKTF